MPLSAGDKLGPHEILSLLGEGGMGEVYRARDTTLKREVALKVLPAAFLRDHDRMARFQREAEVLASLDHPNIGHIYGIVDSEGSRALVLALIEGPTLADRIEAGPLPIEEAVAIAKQIVDALEYAHDRGVIHRDLKPANVKITSEGVVKVLDFGLAKVLEDEPTVSSLSNSPTLTVGHTRAGVILGTAAYMSPEQAVGRVVDRRSDIFSFGAVLYEMLTGQRAFAGGTTPDVLETVVKNDPDWSKLAAKTPAAIRKLLERCLIKDRKERLQAIGEARIVLRNPLADEPVAASAPSRSRFSAERWIAVVMIFIAGVALWGWLKPTPTEPRVVTRFTIPLPADPTSAYMPSLSADGTRVAFRSGNPSRFYVRTMDQLEAKPIPGTEGGVYAGFSPDGQWIAFLAPAGSGNVIQLKKIPVTGGAAMTLVESAGTTSPYLSWGSDDNILFTTARTGLQSVPATGGKTQILASPDAKQGEIGFTAPQLLPGGKKVLFTVSTGGGLPSRVAALDLQTGEKKILLEGAGLARYGSSSPGSMNGQIVYVRGGSLFAAPFDVNRLQVGSPTPVVEGVLATGLIGGFALSDSGTLVYLPGSASAELPLSTLVWVDHQGVEQPLAAPPRAYADPRISPDGQRVAVAILTAVRFPPPGDIWLYEVARGTLTRRTFEGSSISPIWTPDGKQLIYRTITPSTQLRSVPADGSGPSVTLLASEAPPYVPSSVSPDGKLIILQRPKPGAPAAAGGEVWTLSMPDGSSGSAKPQALLESQFTKNEVQFSPDSRWVVYQSNESGRNEIYVVPYPGPGGKSQISTDGGTTPRWSSNGRELFYRNGDKVMAVEVQTGATVSAGTPKMLFEKAGQYEVAPDGKRFLMVKAQAAASQGQQSELQVVANWFEELRRRTPLGK